MSGRVTLAADIALRIAKENGTPCYVQDLALVRAQYRRLRAALPDYADIYYAMKANPHPAVVGTVAAAGAGLEVASAGELERARAAGHAGRRIAFAGPAKRDTEIRAALEVGVILNVESRGEFERADRIAGELGVTRAVSVRVSPPWGTDEDVSIIGGVGPSKFGVDLDQLDDFLPVAAAAKNLRLTGLHVFNASNVLDAAAHGRMCQRVFELARHMRDERGVPLELVDVGGGLGVPYSPEREPLDVEALGRELTAAYQSVFGAVGPRVILEPGRYLVAEAGTFLTRVLDRKSCRGREFLLCDGGINNLLRPALIGQAHPMAVVGRDATADDGEYDVAGPLCTSLDFLAKGVRLADPEVGDLIAIGCAGAYGYTESMLDFLSHPHPAQVMLNA